MTTDIWTHIRADLRRVLLGIPGIPDVAYELAPVAYKPTPGVAYIRERVEKGNSTTATFGTFGETNETGIYHIDLYWPDKLTADGERLADKIRLAFWHGREIASSGPDKISGGVTATSARSAIPSAGWVIFPVRVAFFVRRKTAQGRAA